MLSSSAAGPDFAIGTLLAWARKRESPPEKTSFGSSVPTTAGTAGGFTSGWPHRFSDRLGDVSASGLAPAQSGAAAQASEQQP
jgi:hypothetical protein